MGYIYNEDGTITRGDLSNGGQTTPSSDGAGCFWLIIVISLIVVVGGIIWLVYRDNSSNNDLSLEKDVEVEEVDGEEETVEEDKKVIPSFNFEAYRYYRSSEDAEIELKADFPTCSSIVADSVRQYIHEIFGGQYRCSYKEAQDILNYYGENNFRDLEKEHQETVGNIEYDDNNENEDTYMMSAYKLWKYFKVDCIENRFVTYKVESFYWTGGIHEMGYEYGVTFNRTNGKRVNYSYFSNLESSSFKKLLKEGLRMYFLKNEWEASTDEELAECLQNVDDINDIPLPSAKPYFTPKGVCFKYGSYEVACFAAGYPSFILPYDEAWQYMTEEAIELITGE